MFRNSTWHRAQLLAATLAFATFQIAVTRAQDADARALALEEIVVSARKRDETLLRVPISVSALPAERIEEAAVRSLEDLSKFTPGLFFAYQSNVRNDRSAQSSIVIRGINPRSSFTTRQTAQLFLDGAPIAGGGVRALEDFERVEVIRGPQSAYFGRSTFSGAINFVTKAPSDTLAGRVTGTMGRFGNYEGGFAVEGPLVDDRLGLRLTANTEFQGGQYSNVAVAGEDLGERRTDAASLTAHWQVGERSSVKAFVQYYEDHDGPQLNQLLTSADYNCAAGAAGARLNWFCGNLPGMDPSRLAANTAVDAQFRGQFIRNDIGAASLFGAFVDSAGLEREAAQATLRAEHRFANGLGLQFIGAYADTRMQAISDLDLADTSTVPNPNFGRIPGARPVVNWLGLVSQLDRSTSYELRLESGENASWRWVVGASAARQESASTAPFDGPFGPDRQLSYTVRDPRTEALFAAAYVDLGVRWTLSLESRFQRDRIRDENRLNGVVLRESFDSVTPRLILDFQPDDTALYYLSASRGVRPGAFNANLLNFTSSVRETIAQLSGAALAVDQEQLDMYELGAKWRLLEGRLQLTAATYWGDWTDQHVSSTVPIVDAATGRTTLVNVVSAIGRTALSGVELEATLQTGEYLALQAGFAFNETDIREFVCAQCQSTITGSGDVQGNRLANTPRTNGALGITFRRPVSSTWDGFGRADFVHRGSQYATEANLARIESSNTVNLRVGAESQSLRVEAFVTNLLDDDTYKTATFTPNLANLTFGNALAAAPAERRVYGVRARYAF